MPLVIFIDDLQWADESTLGLTQHLAQQLTSLPIVVIAASRDVEASPIAESKGRFQSCWTGSVVSPVTSARRRPSRQRSISWSASGRPAPSCYARSRTPTCRVRSHRSASHTRQPGLVQKFADRTGGNPFFVVELFRHLKDDGRLFDARNEWKRDLDLDDVELPDTVRVVLERRITRVSSDAQNLLRAAAVLGPQFEPDLLEEVADVKSATLTAALNEAERARIVIGPSGRRDITWRFAHQLTCQMLTAAMPQPQRQRLHLRVADAMTRLGHESRGHESRIAHHLYWAGRLADPDRTARALIAAGDAAHAIYASEEAVQHYRRALEVLQETNGDMSGLAGAGAARGSAGAARRSRRSDGTLRNRERRISHHPGDRRSGAHRSQDRHPPLAGR
jgi:predicted ATPase